MKRAIAWFARNSVAANLMMLLIVASGLLTLSSIKLEVFPEVSSELISVTVPYLGAAPVEVEEGVCVKIEEAIQDLEGIKKLTSTAAEGIGTVLVEVDDGADARKLREEVKTRVDAIITFPEQTERPVVQEVALRFQVMNVALSGAIGEASLRSWGDMVRDELQALDAISQVSLSAARPYEISIEVEERALRRWGLQFDDVVRAVRSSSLDLPGGSVRTESGEVLLRTKGQAYRGEDFEDLTLLARDDGTRLRIGDVARVVDGFAETDQAARFDGQPAVLLQVFRVGDQSALEIAGAVEEHLESLRARLPDGVEVTVWQDDTRLLRDRLGLLLRNGRTGLLLVFLVLALFLKLRLAMWVAVGIAVSFTGALWVMPYFDVSINVMSLFAFIVVLGIVVDDAIVIGENVARHQELGEEGAEAAIAGAQEVSTPVTFSILTSVAAFSTLLSAPGAVGKVLVVVPIIAMATLFFSMVESLFILPAHLAHMKTRKPGKKRNPWRRLQIAVTEALRRFIEGVYRPVLGACLRWRYLTVAVCVVLLMLTLGAVGGGWVQFDFFPEIAADNAVAVLTMPRGTPIERTEAAMEKIEAAAAILGAELEAQGHGAVFQHVLRTIGEQPFTQRSGAQASFTLQQGSSGAHLGEVNIELSPSENREVGSKEIADRWRELTGPIPEAVELVFSSNLLAVGEDLDIELSSQNLEVLRDSAAALKLELERYPGVTEITDSFRPGKQEIRVAVTEQAEALGYSLSDVARQVRQGFYGEEAQRIQRGRHDVRVMVRYSSAERRTLASLEGMRVRHRDGTGMPFSQAARVELERGYSTITRVDRRRTINVRAQVDSTVASANEIRADLASVTLPALLADFPGVSHRYAGQAEEQRESFAGAVRGFGLALAMIFILLAVPFKSYVQPMIVMSVIPFGFIGAVGGHAILGMSLTMLSIFGVIALTGVVVNDSLVLVDFVNRETRSGRPVFDSVVRAGVIRFRPILLTSLTTFAGLTPLLLERSLQAQFLKPMAASLGFGVLFATPIILIVVPAHYLILEDVRGFFRRLRGVPASADTTAVAREATALSAPPGSSGVARPPEAV